MLTSCPREGWIGETTRAGKGRLRPSEAREEPCQEKNGAEIYQLKRMRKSSSETDESNSSPKRLRHDGFGTHRPGELFAWLFERQRLGFSFEY